MYNIENNTVDNEILGCTTLLIHNEFKPILNDEIIVKCTTLQNVGHYTYSANKEILKASTIFKSPNAILRTKDYDVVTIE